MRRVMSGLIGGGVAGGIVMSTIVLAQTPKTDTPRPDGPAKSRPIETIPERKPDSAPPGAVAAEEEQKLKDEIQETVRLFRRVLLPELQFVRVACEPTSEQRRRIKQEAGRLLERTVSESVRKEQASEKKGQGRETDVTHTMKQYHAGLAVVVKSHLTPEQWARYQQELKKRSAHRKRTAVRNLLAHLDRALGLTERQRDQIGESLDTHWDENWNSIALLLDDGEYPEIPDPLIVPFLTQVQSASWKGLSKMETTPLDREGILAEVMEGIPEEDEIEPGRAGKTGPRH
jgi:hypothetical protein